MATAAQITANRENAQFSSGPTSEAGKQKSSLNAVKTGLTGRTVLLPGEDAAIYESHVAHFFAHFAPAGEQERILVQSLADTEWRLLRIPSLEMSIYALGRLEFADLFENEDEPVRNRLIEAKILLTYERQLRNLGTQESRLRRQRDKDTAALRELQEERKHAEQERLTAAAELYIAAVQENRHHAFDPAEFGFEFSIAQIEVRALEIDPDLFLEYELSRRKAA